MNITEKKHWENGHQTRGGWFHTFNASLGNVGIMISWPFPKSKGINSAFSISFFKLI